MFIDFPLDCIKNSYENVTEIIKSNKEEIARLLKIENKTYLNFMRPLMEHQAECLFLLQLHILLYSGLILKNKYLMALNI